MSNKATIKDGRITLLGCGPYLSIDVEDLSPDKPHVVANALEEAYRHGHMNGASEVASAASNKAMRIRNGDEGE